MPEPVAYLNGQLLPASQAVLPVYDTGFVLGATVTEQLRTFRGELFRLPEHLNRLHTSLQTAGIEPRESLPELADIAARLVADNRRLIDPADDLGLCIFITPGPYTSMAEGVAGGPTVGLHTYRLPFHLWADRYQQGVALRTTPIQQVPPECWPAALKCRSRMHYFLADQEAAEAEPGSRALLLNAGGLISETSTANVVAYYANRGLVSPPLEQVLPGISLQVVTELAGRLGIPFANKDLKPDEFARADEAFVSSTPNCLLPVTRLNGQAIGNGQPGKVFQQLLAAWNEMAELDIAAQARKFSKRS
ncbi:MAG TPA: aminotransferase class IV [Pirellulales bacterium]|jgi:branched-subunit amino acid aminotransferase/4-amino-4-deoxychorismate lyase|nr:aminotransferase class IV [Pirellulales bacterium]